MREVVKEDTRYSVTSAGDVYGPKGTRLAQSENGRYGYRKVSLGRGRQRYVHRLVAAAFLGDADGREVDHINGDVSDNRVSNLRYLSHRENMAAMQTRITHCKRGHRFDDALAWSRSGRRICLQCRRARDRERRPSKRSQYEKRAETNA